jgi:hypothetical protein
VSKFSSGGVAPELLTRHLRIRGFFALRKQQKAHPDGSGEFSSVLICQPVITLEQGH